MASTTVMGNLIGADNQIDVDVYARGEDGRGISSSIVQYQTSKSFQDVPSGDWQDSIPTVEEGQYLWTRTLFMYDDDTTSASYSVSYFAINGAVYTPNVDEQGNISWTNDKGLVNPDTTNIRGPQGEKGSVKFNIVNNLPTTNIENDAFYIVPLSETSDVKKYNMYYYVIAEEDIDGIAHFEKVGDDLSIYYTQSEVNQLLADYVSNIIEIKGIEEDKNYYLTGSSQTEGQSNLYGTGFAYHKAAAADKGEGTIDGQQITVGLFYNIS